MCSIYSIRIYTIISLQHMLRWLHEHLLKCWPCRPLYTVAMQAPADGNTSSQLAARVMRVPAEGNTSSQLAARVMRAPADGNTSSQLAARVIRAPADGNTSSQRHASTGRRQR